jgi:signal peptidase
VLEWLATGAVVLLALVAVAAGVLVRTQHLQFEPVLSGSMRPTFAPGDLVVAKQVSTASLHTGEVVAFYPPGQAVPVMHRIVRITWAAGVPTIVTKGDANRVTDPWGEATLHSPTTYRFVAAVPKLGFLSVWSRHLSTVAHGWLFIIAGAVVLALGALELRHGRSATPATPVATE